MLEFILYKSYYGHTQKQVSIMTENDFFYEIKPVSHGLWKEDM